jgi:hypothetical protein
MGRLGHWDDSPRQMRFYVLGQRAFGLLRGHQGRQRKGLAAW